MLGTSLLQKSTVAFTYLKVKSAKCLCLFPVVLVSHFGLGLVSNGLVLVLLLCLGLKNLVLFTSLENRPVKTKTKGSHSSPICRQHPLGQAKMLLIILPQHSPTESYSNDPSVLLHQPPLSYSLSPSWHHLYVRRVQAILFIWHISSFLSTSCPIPFSVTWTVYIL